MRIIGNIKKIFCDAKDAVIRTNRINRNPLFAAFYERHAPTFIMVMTVVAVFMILGFSFLDLLLELKEFYLLIKIRTIAAAVLLLNAAASMIKPDRLRNRIHLFAGFYILVVYSAFLSYFAGGDSSSYWAGFNFVLIFWTCLVPFRYYRVFISSILFVVMYNAVLLHLQGFEYSSVNFAVFNVFFAGTIFIGGVISFFTNSIAGQIFLTEQELRRKSDSLAEMDRLKTDFVANISHEFRTPLTLMLSPVKEAMQGYPLTQAQLAMISRNGDNLLNMVNELLDISKLDAGKNRLYAAEIDMSQVWKRFASDMDATAASRKISLSLHTGSGDMRLFADLKCMSRIASNLFSNSFKFTDPGGRIDIYLESGIDTVKLIFSDTGRGIPAGKLSGIFDRFVQAETGSSRSYEGTGIGLFVVRELIELHGGMIGVESRHISDYRERHGTVFTAIFPKGREHLENREYVEFTDFPFEIPLLSVRTDNRHAEVLTAEEKNDGIKPSLLIVEDNRDMQSFLSSILSPRYTIICAGNGREGLEMLRVHDTIDLVVSDLMMPEMDGVEMLEKIRENEVFNDLPVLFLTAREEHLYRIRVLALGASDYISKPFSPDELTLRIANQLEMRRMRKVLIRHNKKLLEDLALKSSAGLRHSAEQTETMEKKVEAVIAFIRDNFTESISRDEISAAVGMSPDHLSRIFNRITGKRIDAFISELRIEEAKRLLRESDRKMITIAMDTGFESLRQFNRVFHDTTGVSPSNWKKTV